MLGQRLRVCGAHGRLAQQRDRVRHVGVGEHGMQIREGGLQGRTAVSRQAG